MTIEITAEILRSLYDYDKTTGVFRPIRGHHAGRVVGKLNKKGHRRICIRDRNYYAGRLAFLYVYGRWPSGMIDHRNGDPDDNRIENLREAAPWQNSANGKNRKIGRDGLRGVRKQAKGEGWQAQISHRSKRYALGTFRTKEEAHAAYLGAAVVLRGEFNAAIPDPLPRRPVATEIVAMSDHAPTIDYLKTILSYDPDAGLFKWLVGRGRYARPGQIAGSKHGKGHIVIHLRGMAIGAHRLAWAFAYGEFPAKRWVDHINGVRDDNRIINLRLATPKENSRNSGGWARRKSPHKGVHFSAASASRPWRAQIGVDGKKIYLGSYATAKEAHEAYMQAAREYFGEFARGGPTHMSVPGDQPVRTALPKATV